MNGIYQFKQTSKENTDIFIYGDIMKGSFWEKLFGKDETRVDAYSFKELLSEVETPKITVRINSMGGSVSEALAIYNLLSEFNGEVETVVDGFACSAASVIFMAGSKRVVPESAMLMIHNAWSRAEGDANAMKKAAETLEKVTQPSVNIYCKKTGLDESVIKELMDKETWLDSAESYEKNFATAITRNDFMQSLDQKYFVQLVKENKQLRRNLMSVETELSQMKENTKPSKWDGFFN